MSGFFENMDGRKLAIVTGVFLLISGVFMVVNFMGANNAATTTLPEENDPGSVEEEQPIEEDLPNVGASTKIYLTDFYSVTYPESWIVDGRDTEKGGRFAKFVPADSVNNRVWFSISHDSNVANLALRMDMLEALGYQKSEISIASRPFTKFSGQSEADGVDYWKTDLFTTTQNRVVVFTYQYEGSAPNTTYEAFFQDILDTVVVF